MACGAFVVVGGFAFGCRRLLLWMGGRPHSVLAVMTAASRTPVRAAARTVSLHLYPHASHSVVALQGEGRYAAGLGPWRK